MSHSCTRTKVALNVRDPIFVYRMSIKSGNFLRLIYLVEIEGLWDPISAQVNGEQIIYTYNVSETVLTFSENNQNAQVFLWNESRGKFTISLDIYSTATIGNLILMYPGFWIGTLIAYGFWFFSTSLENQIQGIY